MKRVLANAAVVLAISSAISIGCGSDDDSSTTNGGSSGKGGNSGNSGAAGKGGMNGTAGGGIAGGLPGGGTGGLIVELPAGTGGVDDAGGVPNIGPIGEGGEGGTAPLYSSAMIARGTVIVRSMALCGGCHTATAGSELAGNPAFKNSTLPAPNLTPDATGIGSWTDAQIMNAFRNGINDKGRHLDSAMPYWQFHNMSDADALAVVAFLRSLPPVSGAVGTANPDATPVTPLAPSAFPVSSLQAASADYAAAQTGLYLVSSVTRCVSCHSVSTAGLPTAPFFSGVAPTSVTQIFAPNITPDVTGLNAWTAADVVTALKVGTNKLGTTLCGSMPSGSKGYGGLSDADAHAIGVYLTTIPAVSKAAADPSTEPACP
ncbi:MAG TPA: cytochrome c [Polyangiaceae bacterium]